jgi:flagellar hook-associated protein 1
LSNPAKIAAAGAVQANAAAGNTGSATVSSGTVVNAANPSLLVGVTLAFTSPTTYSVNGAGSFAYTSGGNIAQNGWQVQISGAPAAGDTFTVQSNAGATGDNRNALLSANLQSTPVLQNGTASVTSAVSALVTGIGSQAEQINTAQTAQAAVNTQAVADQQSTSGVNLDEEAAHLLQWQQAYQAAAKALQIGSSLFQNLLTAVQSA